MIYMRRLAGVMLVAAPYLLPSRLRRRVFPHWRHDYVFEIVRAGRDWRVLFASSPASAQSAAEKAQGGLGGYLAILAIGKLCNFDLDKPATEAIVSNINAPQKTAKMTDAELDQSLAAL